MAPLTIRSVTARPVLAPLPRPLRTASGEIPAAPLLLLDVETHQGVTGRAYVFGYTPTVLTPLRAFVDNLAELLVGRPVAPADRAEQLALAFRLLGRQGLVGMALSGLDMALWDALGRHQGRPVVELLGGIARRSPATAIALPREAPAFERRKSRCRSTPLSHLSVRFVGVEWPARYVTAARGHMPTRPHA